MTIKKIICALILLSFMLTLVSPALATSQESKLVKVYSILDDKPAAKPGKPPPSTASVNIRNLATGDTVCSQVSLLVIAQVTGAFDSVVCQIGTGPEMAMGRVDSSDRYQSTYDTSGLSAGKSTLTVSSKSGSTVVSLPQ